MEPNAKEHPAAENDANAAHSDPTAWCDAVRERALARAPHDPSQPPHSIRWAFLIAVALHIVLFVTFRNALQTPPVATEQSIRVDLIELNPVEPPLPEPAALPARPAIVSKTAPTKPTTTAPPRRSTTTPEEVSSTEPHIFNIDGSIDLPKETAPAKPPGYFPPPVVAMSPIMKHARPLKVRPNHFDKYWVETEGLAGLAEQLTTKKEFTTPWGTKVECVTIAFLLGGCGWYTPSPYYVPVERWKPASVLDER